MGFFSNAGNSARLAYLKTVWLDCVEPQLAMIKQRGVEDQLEQSVLSYFDDAILSVKNSSPKQQIKNAKKSIVSAYSIKDSNIVDSCALFLVAVYVEVCCRMIVYPEFMVELDNLLSQIQLKVMRAGGISKANEYLRLVGFPS